MRLIYHRIYRYVTKTTKYLYNHKSTISTIKIVASVSLDFDLFRILTIYVLRCLQQRNRHLHTGPATYDMGRKRKNQYIISYGRIKVSQESNGIEKKK